MNVRDKSRPEASQLPGKQESASVGENSGNDTWPPVCLLALDICIMESQELDLCLSESDAPGYA